MRSEERDDTDPGAPSPVNPISGLTQSIAPPGLGTIQKWTKQVYGPAASSSQAVGSSGACGCNVASGLGRSTWNRTLQ